MKRKWMAVTAAAVLLAAGGATAGLAVAAQTIPAPGPAWGCVTGSSRILEHVYTVQQNFQNYLNANGGSCPGTGSFPVAIGAPPAPAPSPSPTPTTASPSPTPTTASPSPTPTTASPTPAPTTPTPTPTGAWAWCSTSPDGFMQFGNLALYSGEWNSSLLQQICGNSGSDWQAVFSAPAGQTGILTYPDVQLNYNSAPPLVSALSPSAVTSWAEDMNVNPGTSAEAAFDIWLNVPGQAGRQEVMIWTDTFNRGTVGGASKIAGPVSFCGRDWELWQDGAELIWYLPASEKSGSACTAQMLQWLQSHGQVSTGASLSQYEYGFEIASTGGTSEAFRVTSYGVSGLPPRN